MDTKTQLTFLSFGPALTLIFAFAFIVMAGMVPPPGPSLSALEVAAFFQQHPVRTGFAMVLVLMSMGMIAPWATTLALRLRCVEGKYPVLLCSQLVNIAVAVIIVILCPIFWAAAAFRPDTSPDIVRVMNDLAFFIFLAPWPPFSFWICAMAWAILLDKRPKPEFPRWTAWLSIWVATLFIPASCVLIFKTGPFAWNGLLGFYVPLTGFFVWLVVITTYAFKGVLREARDGQVN